MCYAAPLFVVLPLLIGAQPSLPPSASTYQERLKQILPTERNGLPDIVFLDSPELLARSNLVGTWRASYLEHDGQSHPEIAAGLTMKFSRGRIELMQRARPTVVVAYNVVTSKIPSGLIWSLPSSGGVMLQDGIY